MATANQAGAKRRIPWLKLLVALFAIGGGVAWVYGERIAGFSQVGTSYAAKNVCSCRYIAGREAGQCRDDLLPGMGTIWLSEDEAGKSVTARVPLVESTTATYREGYGCVLEKWEG